MEALRLWLAVVIPALNLLAILLAGIKILNRQTREFDQRESRMLEAEKAITQLQISMRELQKETSTIVALSVRVEELCSEMKRIRDRLDRWLDNRGVSAAAQAVNEAYRWLSSRTNTIFIFPFSDSNMSFSASGTGTNAVECTAFQF